MFTRKSRRSSAVIAALAGLMVAISACSEAGTGSGGDGDSGSGSENTNQAWYKNFEAEVAKGYDGVSTEDPPAGPAAVKGKNVWFISASESCAGCALVGKGFKEAARELDWNLKYLDAKGDPSAVAAAVDQAIAAKADAIATGFFDCSTIKNALEKAKSAGIPVVTNFAADCDEPLFSAITTLDGKPGGEGLNNYTYVKTAWAITKLKGDVKAIAIKEDDLQSVVEELKGFNRAMDECDSCEVVSTVNLTLSTQTNIQALLAAELTKHPEANVVTIPFGGLLPMGARAAIEQAGRQKDLYVVGAACDGGEVDLMKSGWNILCGGYEQHQMGWMAADYINRFLAGEEASELPKVGIGYQLVDRDHNLPADGETWTTPTDYKSAYRAAWNK